MKTYVTFSSVGGCVGENIRYILQLGWMCGGKHTLHSPVWVDVWGKTYVTFSSVGGCVGENICYTGMGENIRYTLQCGWMCG